MPAKQTRDIARSALRGNWVTAVLVALVAGILGGTSNAFTSSASSAANNATSNGDALYGYGYYSGLPSSVYYTVVGLLGTLAVVGGILALVTLVLGGAVRQGLCQYNINLVKKDAPAEFNVLFSKFSNFGKCFLLNLVMSLLVFLWSLLFIIPGIIAGYRYAMAPYIMAQNPEIGVMDAIRASKQMMDGNKARLFCLQLSFIGWSLLAAFTCGLGFLLLNPYIHAAEATFYLNLTGQLPGMQYAAPGAYAPGGPQQPYGQYTQGQPYQAPPQDYTQQQYAPPPQGGQPYNPPGGTYPPPPTDPPQA